MTQLTEETKYLLTLMAFKSILEKYGEEQVQYDLNRLAAEFNIEINRMEPRTIFKQQQLDFGD